MTDERDPVLQTMFANAHRELEAESFTDKVMARTDKARRLASLTWLGAGLALAVVVWLILTPLPNVLTMLALAFTKPLFALDNPLLAEILLPLNSIAGMLAAGFLVLRFAYRRIAS